jgi:hypothetical protein
MRAPVSRSRPVCVRCRLQNGPMPTNPGRLVYGTIAVGTLLAAESARQETYVETVFAVAITLLLYWLAHSYSEFVDRRLEHGKPFSLDGFADAALHELAVLVGAAIPLIVLVIWWLADASLGAAVSAAVWTSAIVIVVIEIVIGRRAELSGREFVTQTAFGTILGLLVIAVRLLLH